MNQTDILQWLQEVQHPAKGDQSVVALGMVEGIELADGSIHVTLAFPKRPDPLKNYLVGAVEACLYRNAPGGTEIEVDTVVKDPAKPAKKGIEFNLEQLREVRHIIGIASGKGGVGKSTVAVNLAVALARLGYRVGVADADVYGPSIPTMTGTENIEIEMYGEDENNNLFVPVEKYGVKWLSVGHVSSAGQALIWRGPMASTALKQIILQTLWGPLDFLLIDMPPGTGDIHISLIGDVPMSGAVIVTTPQNVALADVLRGVNMFRNPQVNKPIYGLVENMSWFTPEAHPEEKYYLFGKDGGTKMAQELEIPLLGQIPLVQGIREGGDSGEPVALGTRPDSLAFLELAQKLAASVDG
ncbi:MAG: Mrp/NBP35 family ATP-binding protein [Bacteroidales bacterium]|nr:Mrp/NBP35 family ATP-binding protein [Bacteroidales bacterium]